MVVMSTKDKDHLVSCEEDADGNLVVAIKKYNGLNCLIHSVYGILVLVLLVGAIVALILGVGVLSAMLVVLSLFFWAVSWLKANDGLKSRIYTEIFKEHLLKKNVITVPLIVTQYYPDEERIKCITTSGEEQSYNVEFVLEKPLYLVRIHTKPEQKN